MKKSLFLLVVSFLTLRPAAQISPASEWEWLKGSNSYLAPAVYGTMGVAGPLNSPGLRNGGTTWTDNMNKLWLFGGTGYDVLGNYGYLNDLWQFDPATNEWTWIMGSNLADQPGSYGSLGVPAPGNNPGSRTFGVAWADKLGNLYLFGGTGHDAAGSTGLLGDLWVFNIALDQWTWLNGSNAIDELISYGTQGIASPGNAPGSRSGASGWFDKSGKLWLFGGFTLSSYLGDLWQYDPATNWWTWEKGNNSISGGVYGIKGVSAPTNLPGSRHMASSWTDAAGNFWLFGGLGEDATNTLGYLNDLWQYNFATNQWVWVSGNYLADQNGNYGTAGVASATNVPGARAEAFAFTDINSNPVIFGGFGHDGTGTIGKMGDLWTFDATAGLWTWQKGMATVSEAPVYGTMGTPAITNTPGARREGFAWSGPNNIYLFGDDYGSDLWTLSLSPIILPLRFVSFATSLSPSGVKIEWTTAEETNTRSFDVETSIDGRNYQVLGQLQAGGSVHPGDTYSFLQTAPDPGEHYYRIKAVDNDGSYHYSVVKIVQVPESEFLIIAATNPFSTSIQASLSVKKYGQATMILTDASGRRITEKQTLVSPGEHTIKLAPGNLGKGLYFLKVFYNGQQQTLKLVHL